MSIKSWIIRPLPLFIALFRPGRTKNRDIRHCHSNEQAPKQNPHYIKSLYYHLISIFNKFSMMKKGDSDVEEALGNLFWLPALPGQLLRAGIRKKNQSISFFLFRKEKVIFDGSYCTAGKPPRGWWVLAGFLALILSSSSDSKVYFSTNHCTMVT